MIEVRIPTNLTTGIRDSQGSWFKRAVSVVTSDQAITALALGILGGAGIFAGLYFSGTNLLGLSDKVFSAIVGGSVVVFGTLLFMTTPKEEKIELESIRSESRSSEVSMPSESQRREEDADLLEAFAAASEAEEGKTASEVPHFVDKSEVSSRPPSPLETPNWDRLNACENCW